jgi:hypothetical protein
MVDALNSQLQVLKVKRLKLRPLHLRQRLSPSIALSMRTSNSKSWMPGLPELVVMLSNIKVKMRVKLIPMQLMFLGLLDGLEQSPLPREELTATSTLVMV